MKGAEQHEDWKNISLFLSTLSLWT